MRKRMMICTGLAAALILSGFFIPVHLQAPTNVRVILDHTNQVYVSPPCFNDAELSNFLEEATYGEASKEGYEPASSCTSSSLTEQNVTIHEALLKLAGLKQSKWSSDIWES
ncbi:hypothetical protein [Salibacterium halotolerans]|uniref:Uncharacterized protein n=1 Tax=Salibacterium halotolerans TaxID=1884432 RepID=A0A1I5M2E3_9BACI|nr:hypothetical protein [Salibacterium halotolerans]SFP03774.1 hypothetical protein SAMN05518683_10272 [Salibacterium halotolerans]